MRIIADSSCDLYSLDYQDFKTVPLTIYTKERSFVDDENLNITEMLDYLASYKDRSYTSCPSIDAFKEANPDFAGYDYVVEAVGEGDAAGNMITDVEAGADIFVFAQDQIARLVSAGALIDVAPENAEIVESENDAGAVGAATSVP